MRTNGTWVPQFFSDLERVLARNGRPAYALLVNRQAKVLTQLAYAGYPCFNMISRDFDFQASDLVRSVYWPQNFGASSEYTAAIYSLATTEGGGDFEDGQGIEVELDGDDQLALVNNFPETRSPTYPDRAKLITLATHSGRDSQPSELLITSVTANGPFVHALLFAQCPQSFELNDDDLSSTAVVGASEIHAKGEIVGFRSLSAETLQQFQIIYENTFRNMRPQYGW